MVYGTLPEEVVKELLCCLRLLSRYGVGVLDSIIRTSASNKNVYKSDGSIAKELGCCRDTVQRLRNFLHDLGLVVTLNRGVKITCLTKLCSVFDNLNVRRMFVSLLPSLYYFPHVALISAALVMPSACGFNKNVAQDINNYSYYNYVSTSGSLCDSLTKGISSIEESVFLKLMSKGKNFEKTDKFKLRSSDEKSNGQHFSNRIHQERERFADYEEINNYPMSFHETTEILSSQEECSQSRSVSAVSEDLLSIHTDVDDFIQGLVNDAIDAGIEIKKKRLLENDVIYPITPDTL